MSAWLKSIQAALKKVTGEDSVEPDYEGCKYDHVVGVADQELRKLYFLFLQNKKQSQEAAAAVLTLGGKDREAKLQEAAKYDSQADVLKDMFWVSCRHAFPELWSKPNIGIRKGWKVVWTEHEHQGLEVLGALMGASALEALLRGGGQDGKSNEATGSGSSRMH
jgi:hypothetical protein